MTDLKYIVSRMRKMPNNMRHRRGFGVQSPWSFNFVRNVLRQKYPYYAYGYLSELRKIMNAKKVVTRKQGELLFRLANYHKPDAAIIVGKTCPAIAACYINAWKTDATTLCLSQEISEKDAAVLDKMGIWHEEGDMRELCLKHCDGDGKKLILMYDEESQPLFKDVVGTVDDDTMLVFMNIHTDAGRKNWREIIGDDCVNISFDLGKTGIVVLDKTKTPGHYSL